jgi:hypothetical protein
MVRIMSDPIRDKLWADVYVYHLAKGKIPLGCEGEANMAVRAYDLRPAPKQQEQLANPVAKEPGSEAA